MTNNSTKRKNHNMELPQAVKIAFKYQILDGIKKNARDYELIESEMTTVPFDAIKTCKASDKVTTLRLKIKRKNKTLKQLDFYKDPVTIINQIVSLDYTKITPEFIKKFPTLREQEDELSRIVDEEENKRVEILYNQTDTEAAQRIIQQLPLRLVKQFNLGIIVTNFKDTDGFIFLLKEIIEALYEFSHLKKGDIIRIQGKLYELGLGYFLKHVHNEEIVAFTKKYRSNEYGDTEFDIITKDKFIECKYSEPLNFNRLSQQAIIAKHHHKQFVVYIMENISEDSKKEFTKRNITYNDGMEDSIMALLTINEE